MNSCRVVLGFSGGVDSSAAALLLKKQGYDVITVTLDFLGDTAMLEKAHAAAAAIGVKHEIVNVQKTFQDKVIRYFTETYLKGETPNPCVYCDTFLKFPLLLETADTFNAHWIATGHYLRLEKNSDGSISLLKSQVFRKDQSYYLYALHQSVLKRLIFPLSDFHSKDAVRNVLWQHGIRIPPSAESQGICFIPENGHARFLKQHLPVSPKGYFKDLKGHVLGTHNGYYQFTVGQKKGLPSSVKGLSVLRISPDDNTVYLGEEAQLYKDQIVLSEVNFINGRPQSSETAVTFKVCRWGEEHHGILCIKEKTDAVLTDFDRPVRAPMPGQSAVFYEEERLLGGGIIKG